MKKRLLDLRGIPLYLLYDAHKTLHYTSGRHLSYAKGCGCGGTRKGRIGGGNSLVRDGPGLAFLSFLFMRGFALFVSIASTLLKFCVFSWRQVLFVVLQQVCALSAEIRLLCFWLLFLFCF